jgi:hypothetical protein
VLFFYASGPFSNASCRLRSLIIGPTMGAAIYDRFGRQAVFMCVLAILVTVVMYIGTYSC